MYIGTTQKRKNNEGINETNLGTLFLINKSSKDDEVDFAILLKKDRIIFLVIKLITTIIPTIETKIKPDANMSDRPSGIPLLLKNEVI